MSEQTESQQTELQEEYTFLIKEIVITEKSAYGRRAKLVRDTERNLVKQFEQGEWEGPLTLISTKIREDLKNEGYIRSQLHHIHELVQPEHVDPDMRRTRSGTTDEEFQALEESVFDQTEVFADRTLSDKQFRKLSPAERKQVMEQEISGRKSRKTIDNDRIKHLCDLATEDGIALFDVHKITKEKPPKKFSGQSEMYEVLMEAAGYYDGLSNMCKDLAHQVYNFKPDKEHEKKALEEFEQWVDGTFIPIMKVTTEICEGTKTIMRNITDEKYSNSNRAWMKAAEDKFLAYGNHGSGEVNAVLTNRVILKLGKDVVDEFGDVHKAIPTIVKVNVKREGTREQMGDECTFEMQGTFDCPNCNTSFPISDEQRDLIAGDLFEQAKTTLLCNGLSNAIDTLADNVVYEHVKDPTVWLREKYGKRYSEEQIKKAIVKEGQAEKIKTVDIDPKDITEKRHGMFRNAATRRADKAQHFSDNS